MSDKNPHDLSYPRQCDARGSAKKYYRRQAYYFGRHNSPESYSIFGLWKQLLIERRGEPPSVQEAREILDERESLTDRATSIGRELESLDKREQSLSQREQELDAMLHSLGEREAQLTDETNRIKNLEKAARTRGKIYALTSCAAIAIGVFSVAWSFASTPKLERIVSSKTVETVDGIPLTRAEMNRVRGARAYANIRSKVEADPDRNRRMEERRQRLIELGPRNGKARDYEDGI